MFCFILLFEHSTLLKNCLQQLGKLILLCFRFEQHRSALTVANLIFLLLLLIYIFFYLGLLSETISNYKTAREGGGHFFNSSLPLPPASQTSDISRAITSESSPLHIVSSRTQTGNFCFPSASS